MNRQPINGNQAQDGHEWHSQRYVARWIAARDHNAADERNRARHELELKCFLEAARSRPRQPVRVLDLGCGWGRYLKALLDSEPGSTAIAADFSEPMLQAARKHLSGFRGRVEFQQLDITQTGFLDSVRGLFDVVLCVQTMHHFDPETLLGIHRQVLPVLAPSGIFLNIDRVARPPHLAARLAYRVAGSFPYGTRGFGITRRIDRAALQLDRMLGRLPVFGQPCEKEVSLARHIELMQAAGYVVTWRPLSPQRFALCGHVRIG